MRAPLSSCIPVNEAKEGRNAWPGSPSGDASILPAALEVLAQGEELLGMLSDRAYTRRLPSAYNASIGGHYRHCLDHFQSLLDRPSEGMVDYDHRRRDPLVESDRYVALNETRRLREALSGICPDQLGQPVKVVCKTSYSTKGSQVAMASYGREMMYAIAHAVHHYALIGIMASLQGVALPEGFGIAPSTIKHQRELAVKAA